MVIATKSDFGGRVHGRVEAEVKHSIDPTMMRREPERVTPAQSIDRVTLHHQNIISYVFGTITEKDHVVNVSL